MKNNLINRFLILVVIFLASDLCHLTSALYCQVNIDADNPDIQYIGRFRGVGTKTVNFDWSGSQINTVFNGTSLSLRIQDTPNWGSPAYNVFIDGQLKKIYAVSGQTVYSVATGLANTSHTLLITKRTDSVFSKETFSGFVLDTGKTLQAPPARLSRRIEYIGDSFTSGWVDEAVTSTDTYATNGYLAYGPLTARHFNAEYFQISWAGIGLLVGMGNPPMPVVYLSTVGNDALTDWDFSSWVPDVVVIYLGLNDGINSHQAAYQSAYHDFLVTVRSKYPNAQILCVWNGAGTELNLITAAVNSIGDSKMHPENFNMPLSGTDLSLTDGFHPSLTGQQKLSNALIPIINSIMNWDTVDTSSPSVPGTVKDGTGTTDISSTTISTSLSANWTASTDAESGISGYRYAIGTTQGGSQTVNWTTLGNVLTVTKSGLTLAPGTTYYFSVKAVNGVGLTSPAANSNGQVVLSTAVAADTTPPAVPGTVRDGTGSTDISSTTSRTQLAANWTASTDAESGISRYDYSIGTVPGGVSVLGWTALGNVLTVTKTGLTLTAGATYYFGVRAVNGAGLMSAAVNSNGQVVISTSAAPADTTPPGAPGTVNDGTSADIGSTFLTTTLQANWTAATDADSGIANYLFAIGTTQGGTDVRNWASNGTALNVTKTGLTLTVGTTYYFSVKAVNGAGLTGTAKNSNGQYVASLNQNDTTPPTAPATVRDGTGTADTATTSLLNQLSANWGPSVDAESGIAKYYYTIGTTPGGSDIIGWTDNGPVTSVTQTNLGLSIGTTYYFSVKAQNGVGMQSSTITSSGQFVLLSANAPVITNITKTVTAHSATMTWTTNEAATSQVEYGQTAIYAYSTIQDNNLMTSHSVTINNLNPGTLYHFRVISADALNYTGWSADDTFITSADNSGTQVNVSPNPYSLSHPGGMKFVVRSLEFGVVKIYTMSGKLVRTLSGTNEISWDGTNESNEKVARGVYIYQITDGNGNRITGKLAIIK